MDEKFELVSRCRFHPPARPPARPSLRSSFRHPSSCHRRGLHRIFMSSRAPFLPHIYATAARPDTDLAREAFSTLAFPAENPAAPSRPYSKTAIPFKSSLKFTRGKSGEMPLKTTRDCVIPPPLLLRLRYKTLSKREKFRLDPCPSNLYSRPPAINSIQFRPVSSSRFTIILEFGSRYESSEPTKVSGYRDLLSFDCIKKLRNLVPSWPSRVI